MKNRKLKTEASETLQQRAQGQCQHCLHYRNISKKYEKLIELLYKKIKQLQRKTTSQLTGQKIDEPICFSQISIGKSSQYLQQLINKQNKAPIKITETKSSFSGLMSQSMGSNNSKNESIQKWSNLANNLTQEIMQLKTNFMHVRSCLYSIFREANLWAHCAKSSITFDMVLVLLNIFQYSQSERDEMCRYKKVRMRKRPEMQTKENVFVTVKQI